MAWPTTKDVTNYAYSQFKGNFLAFVVGTLAARLVSTFFETRKVSNLWGLTARKTVVSGDTFRLLEWSCALVVGFIAFVLVNSLLKEKLVEKISSFIRDRGLINKLEVSSPRFSRTIKLIAPFDENLVTSEKNDDATKRKP